MLFEIIAYIFIIGLIIWEVVSIRETEDEIWNNGRCPICNSKWELYDADAHGDRMYKCGKGHQCNISTNADKFFE